MPTVKENLDFWSNYYWTESGDEWSEAWGNSDYVWYGTILPRLQYLLPASSILEIAPGFGRMTNYLRKYCDKLTVVDLAEKCIDACKNRFATDKHINYFVNDGKSLAMIPDKSINFIFSWDSLVHAEIDAVSSYIKEFSRILKPGGIGFIHHSNMGTYLVDDKLTVDNPHWRASNVSAKIFNELCLKYKIPCISQEIINWGGNILNDCFSLFINNKSFKPSIIRENNNFMDEIARLKNLFELYFISKKSQ